MFNAPKFADGRILRYSHQPLTFEHNGVNCSIKTNGQVVISKIAGPAKDNPNEVEIDEIQVPASLIFKLAQSLKLTRKEEYLTPAEIAALESTEK